jgi:predicted MFS family arabinose efflux permease
VTHETVNAIRRGTAGIRPIPARARIRTGWGDPLVVGALVLAGAMLVVFAAVWARSAGPLLPLRLFRNRSLTIGMTVTFVYMATFGVLPYFLTVLMQSAHGYSALQTGLAFLVPSLAIATGTQLGERLSTRTGTRNTLLIGFAIGVGGTAALAFGFDADAGYATLLPGLVVSGVGQGIVWTAMWIAAATGTASHEQGVANGIVSTSLNTATRSAWPRSPRSPPSAPRSRPTPRCSPPPPTTSSWWCC